jgi:hypothetical protein
MRLRPTVEQFSHKFFENTRDGGLGKLKVVSVRLPKISGAIARRYSLLR